tara:strand:+ start:1212 stop:1532 length:321 start_codon:yes stop_codon:yes gene_type:complete
MKVKIGYRVDLEDVPKSVSTNLEPLTSKLTDIKELHDLAVRILSNSVDVVSVQAALNMLNNIRQQIINIDTTLADASSLLIDYTNVLMNEGSTQETTEGNTDVNEG